MFLFNHDEAFNIILYSLAVGAAKGAIATLFSKVKTMNAKHGPFELLLCVGDFFGPLDQVETNEDIGQLLLGKLEGMCQFTLRLRLVC